MRDFENGKDVAPLVSPELCQSGLNDRLYSEAYENKDWLSYGMHCGGVVTTAVGTEIAASLRRRSTNSEGQIQLLLESGLATAFGASLRSWRTTAWPVAAAVGGAAMLFAREKLDPTIGKNAHRNQVLVDSMTDIISHKRTSIDGACVRFGALGDDTADMLLTGSFLVGGVLPRTSRLSCGTLSMYASEGCRELLECESRPLASIACAGRNLERWQNSKEELHTWVSSLNERGLRARLSFAEDGTPLLQPPSLSELSMEKQPVSPEIHWWRDPAHPRWCTNDSVDIASDPQDSQSPGRSAI